MKNPTNTDVQAVAVLGLPELAQHLSAAGLRVVTGDTFRTAAAAANTQIKVAPIAMVMADLAVAGTSPWVEKVVRTCPVVMVGINLDANGTRIGGNTAQVTRLAAPVPVDTVLSSVGLTPIGDGSVLTVDGTVTATVHTAPADLEDSWGELDDLEAAVPAPKTPVAPVPAPTMVVPDTAPAPDFWGTTPVVPIPTLTVVVPDAPPPPVEAPPAPPFGQEEFTMPAVTETTPDTSADPAPWENYVPPAPWRPVTKPKLVEPTPEPETFTNQRVPAQTNPATVTTEQTGVDTGYSPTLGRAFAPCILSLAGKGGVGKTAIALALAQRAAVVGQLKVILIDGNRGQGDLRTYLALNRSGLPTIYDAVTSGDPAAAIVTPNRLNANRPPNGEQLSFALVQAPPQGLTDTETITSALYHDVITAARGTADLVVIDTQIVEGSERGMFDELIIPMLAAHAYGVGIADLSRPGIDNLTAHLREFIDQGVPVERLMTMLNRVPATTQYDLQRTSEALGQYGVFLAAIPADPEIHSSMAYGTAIHDNSVLAPALDQILLRVTGNSVFNQIPTAKPTKKRGGLFRRWATR